MLENNINFWFPVFLEELEKGANFLESKTTIIGRGAAEIWSPSNLFNAYHLQQDLTLWLSLEIFALRKCEYL